METADYLSALNPQQRDAVLYCDGPQLVIAGAGSGKTRVLTHKIMHLLATGYEPWRILALTFTNKAAREMRSRIGALAGEERAGRLWMGTFHSVFARLLRSNYQRVGYKSNFTIYDTSDSHAAIKMIVRDMGLDEKTVYRPSAVAAEISWAKNNLISPAAYAADPEIEKANRQSKRPRLADIYATYRSRCVAANAMDFDDLLYYMHRLMSENPEVLEYYREFFRYILVDEYQDTNRAQNAIVSLLAQPRGALTVVGDDAQSIYSFRGADIRNIIDLNKSFPALRTFKLEQNYRSTQNIINAAGSLIEKNSEGIPKKVFSENPAGAKVEVSRAQSDYEEAYMVASRLSRARMKWHDSLEEYAILYRTNAQSRVLEEALRNRNIPYRIYGGLSFYQRKEIKDATAYFRLALNPDDDEALKRVINFPTRGIGDTTLNKLIRQAMDKRVSLMQAIKVECGQPSAGADGKPLFNAGTLGKLMKFAEMVDGFHELAESGQDAYEAAGNIMETTGLVGLYARDTVPENVSKYENLQELMAGVRQFVDSHREQGDDGVTLRDFMAEVSLATDQDSDDSGEGERVTLMTAHAAKGLEFNNVFVVGVEEDLFPSAMAQSSRREVEEERRLLYVAMTRARRLCVLTWAKQRFRNGMTVFTRSSRFLQDIDPRFVSGEGLTESATRAPLAPPTPPSYPARPQNPMSGYRSSYAHASQQPRQGGGGDYTRHESSELSPGACISHDRFGRGTVLSIDTSQPDHRIVVAFDEDGAKRTLLLKFAKFRIEP